MNIGYIFLISFLFIVIFFVDNSIVKIISFLLVIYLFDNKNNFIYKFFNLVEKKIESKYKKVNFKRVYTSISIILFFLFIGILGLN